MKKIIFILFLLFSFLFCNLLFAQNPDKTIKVNESPQVLLLLVSTPKPALETSKDVLASQQPLSSNTNKPENSLTKDALDSPNPMVSATVSPGNNSFPSIQASDTKTDKTDNDKSTVRFQGQDVFDIYSAGGLSAKERVIIISNRLNKIGQENLLVENFPQVKDDTGLSTIMLNDALILTVNDEEAKIHNKDRKVLAREYANKLELFLGKFKQNFIFKSLVTGLILTLVATLVLIILLGLLKYIYKIIISKITSEYFAKSIPSIKIKTLELVDSSKVASFIKPLVNFIRVLLIIILLYVYITSVFNFFPWTKGYSKTLIGYITEPFIDAVKAIFNYIPNLFFIIVVCFIAYYFNKLIKIIFKAIENETLKINGFHKQWADTTYKIIVFINFAFVLVIIFPYLPGSTSPAFQGISVFVGVLLSLGSGSAISNIVSGIVLTYTNSFRIGDRVKISDTTGDVIEKSLLVTKIRTIKNVEITIPNSMVLSSHIINYSISQNKKGLILHTTVTIGYDAPWKEVHSALIKAAERTPEILKSPEPFVLQTSLDDFYVSYELNAYTVNTGVMAKTYSDLHQNIQDVFNENNIEIMSPHYSTLRDGNMTTIPKDYLPEDYKATPFHINNIDDKGKYDK